jgi:hypothetical protein
VANLPSITETMGASVTDTKRNRGGGVMRGLAVKLLTPLVAAAASAAAGYAAKKGPKLLEETVLPKLREARGGAGERMHDLPAQARSAAGGATDLAQDLAGRVTGQAEGSSSARSEGDRSGGGSDVGSEELEAKREARAERRAARRNASTR